MEKISIIIPTYNHLEDALKPCIDSILRNTDMSNVQLIVVANGCKDGTKDYLEALDCPVDVVWFDEGIGYTKSTNAGIKAARGEYLLLLNNDTEIINSPKNQWIDRLVAPLNGDSQIGMTHCLTLTSPEVGKEFGVFFCAMIPRKIFDKIGPLDEIFSPGFGEDIDFCMKLINNGYLLENVNLSGDFPIIHKAEVTFHDDEHRVEYEKVVLRNQGILREKYSESKPDVAIIMPSYNSTKTVEKSIQSIIDQNYDDWELFIVDDCSTDDSLWKTILKATSNGNKRINIIQKESNGGVSNARNEAIKEITNGSFKYIAYCDSDDIWQPDHLSKSLSTFNSDVDMVYTDPYFILDDGSPAFPFGTPYFKEFDLSKLEKGNYIYISSVVHRIKCLEIGDFDSNLDSIEDWDYWIRMAKHEFKIKHLAEPTVIYLCNDNGMGGKKTKEKTILFHEKHNLSIQDNKNSFDKWKDHEIYKEIYEENCYAIEKGDLEGKEVLDIGAHYGFFAMKCLQDKSKRVISVEPNPNSYQNLVDNLKEHKECRTINAAVHWDKDANIGISNDEEDWTNSIYKLEGSSPIQTTTIEKLLDYFPGNNDIFLKMDCEGVEHESLRGLSRELFRRFSIICIEIHAGNYGKEEKECNVQDLIDYIVSMGYKIEKEGPTIYLTDGIDENGKLINARPHVGLRNFKFKRIDTKETKEKLIKLNLGCGGTLLDGYINCDLYVEGAEMHFDAKEIPFDDNSVDEISAYHLLEHFDYHEAFDVLKEWKRALKPGGKLVVETPDMLNSCKRFIEGDEQYKIKLYGHFFCWPWLSGQTHKFLYTETQLKWTLEELGFIGARRVDPTSIYVAGNHPDLFLKMECNKPKITSGKISVKNTIHNTEPLLVHANGINAGDNKYHSEWDALVDWYFNSKQERFNVPEDLGIITCTNRDEMMLFEKSCSFRGVPVSVLKKKENWINKDKISSINMHLQFSNKKYTMFCDCFDVLLMGSPEKILSRFQREFNCRALFGAEKTPWPPNITVEDDIEGKKLPFIYMNTGLFIGETEFLKSLFGYFNEQLMGEYKGVFCDDQKIIRKDIFKVFFMEVQLDYECKIFQNLSMVNIGEEVTWG